MKCFNYLSKISPKCPIINCIKCNFRNCLIKHPQEEDPDEGVKDLVEIVMRKFDIDKDGKISLKDFEVSVIEEPLLLEAFGKCLPTERARDTFLATIKI